MRQFLQKAERLCTPEIAPETVENALPQRRPRLLNFLK
jgi:hypothetical protein